MEINFTGRSWDDGPEELAVERGTSNDWTMETHDAGNWDVVGNDDLIRETDNFLIPTALTLMQPRQTIPVTSCQHAWNDYEFSTYMQCP